LTGAFSAGGGIGLECCAATDDGRAAYALGVQLRPLGAATTCRPQAGIGVYERGPDGLLAAVRVYDDVEAPPGPR